ncbi:MAG: aminotransferase class I/II-fold pyridoxal phosphate-dependent enzyme [Myxococcota bacterium]
MSRIYLSPPHMGPEERSFLLDAFDSNWIAPLGPHVNAFEIELAASLGDGLYSAALSSGTAGLHLALLQLGVGPGDFVITATLTFAATANAIRYVGAEPVFVDVDPATWTLDPAVLAHALDDLEQAGTPAKAVITVDLYGQICDYSAIAPLCEHRGIPIVEDAAEALGSTLVGRAAGAFGDVSVFSFNGNKIITTSGGGMLVARDPAFVDRVKFLASQARDPAPHYQHSTVGYNYRLSNLLAAIGRAQLRKLPLRVDRRRAIRDRYRAALGDLPGLTWLEDAPGVRGNAWLTCLLIDEASLGVDRDTLREHLETLDIESRPVWKPMHQQPVFAECKRYGGSVSDHLFAQGLCLPSGSSLSEADQDRVIEGFRSRVPAVV